MSSDKTDKKRRPTLERRVAELEMTWKIIAVLFAGMDLRLNEQIELLKRRVAEMRGLCSLSKKDSEGGR